MFDAEIAKIFRDVQKFMRGLVGYRTANDKREVCPHKKFYRLFNCGRTAAPVDERTIFVLNFGMKLFNLFPDDFVIFKFIYDF